MLCQTKKCPGCRGAATGAIGGIGESHRRYSVTSGDWQGLRTDRRRLRDREYRWGLGYGLWFVGEQCVVLFNRRYKPIWSQWSDGRCEPADPNERVPFTLQLWLYDDGTIPKVPYLEQITSDFAAGRPLNFNVVLNGWKKPTRLVQVQP